MPCLATIYSFQLNYACMQWAAAEGKYTRGQAMLHILHTFHFLTHNRYSFSSRLTLECAGSFAADTITKRCRQETHLLILAQALCTDQRPITVVSGQALLLMAGATRLLAVQRATNLSVQSPTMVTSAVAPVGAVVVGNVSVGVYRAA